MPAAAPAAAASPFVIFLEILGVIIAIIVVVCVVHDVIKWIYYRIVGPVCGLETYLMAKDRCKGLCFAPTPVCVATATRSYTFAWWLFEIGTQDAACACGVANSGVSGGTGAPPEGSPDAFLDKVKETVKSDHAEKTDEAIKEAGGGVD